jgi:hypothetical protein
MGTETSEEPKWGRRLQETAECLLELLDGGGIVGQGRDHSIRVRSMDGGRPIPMFLANDESHFAHDASPASRETGAAWAEYTARV